MKVTKTLAELRFHSKFVYLDVKVEIRWLRQEVGLPVITTTLKRATIVMFSFIFNTCNVAMAIPYHKHEDNFI